MVDEQVVGVGVVVQDLLPSRCQCWADPVLICVELDLDQVAHLVVRDVGKERAQPPCLLQVPGEHAVRRGVLEVGQRM